MCADCAGMRYCAYDHSESKYLGRGINGVSGEKVDCRFLERHIYKHLCTGTGSALLTRRLSRR